MPDQFFYFERSPGIQTHIGIGRLHVSIFRRPFRIAVEWSKS